MSASASCCRQCGAPLLAAAGDRDRAALCFACGGTALALLPATIEVPAPPPVPVPVAGPGRPAPLGPGTNPDGPRRLLRDIGASSLPALLLVFGTFMLVASPRPRSDAAAPDSTALVAFANPWATEPTEEMRTTAELDYGSDPEVLVALRAEAAPEGPGDPQLSIPLSPADTVVPSWIDVRPPAVAEAPVQEKADVRGGLKRRDNATEAELLRQLVAVPDVGLNRPQKLTLFERYSSALASSAGTPEAVLFGPSVLLTVRPDLARLPVRQGRSAVLTHKAAGELQALSKKLHAVLDKLTPKDRQGHRPFTALMEQFLRTEVHGKKHEWLRPEAIPTMLQILMPEDTPVRLLLVQLLGEIADRRSTVALAQRAIFDLSREVRESAVEQLRTRPRAEFRYILLDGLRYPWLPVADHAAEALIALSDREAVVPLLGVLKELEMQAAPPESNAPRPKIREMVRLKHVDNCLTCHPPALKRDDPVTGAIPDLSFVSITAKTRQTAHLNPTPTPPAWQMAPTAARRQTATSSMANGGSGGGGGGGGNCNSMPSGGSSSGGGRSNPSSGGSGRSSPPFGGGSVPVALGSPLPPSGGGGGTGGGGGGSGGSGGGGGYGGGGSSSTTSGSTTSVVSVPGHPGMTMSITKETQVTRKEIPVVIRADITYFRQDFSVTQLVGMEPVTEPLRFDFLVRTRPLAPEELRLLKKNPELHPALRQKETVLFTLRELTSKDAGPRLEDWLVLFPEAEDEVEAARLCQELVRATPDKQPGLLAKLKEQPGAAATPALAAAIPQLPEEMRVKVRQALTERLTRLPPSALREKLA